MYSYLTGILKGSSPEKVLLEVNGVGYRVEIPLSLFSRLPSIGSPLTLQVSFIIREFFQALYGFQEEEERDLFELLLDISGIGPKVAISILGHLAPEDLYRAVLSADLDTLSRVPGIGKKKAERILLELKGKLPERHPRATDFAMPIPSGSILAADAVRALVHLGYPHQAASKAVQKGLSKLPESTPLAALITEALRHT